MTSKIQELHDRCDALNDLRTEYEMKVQALEAEVASLKKKFDQLEREHGTILHDLRSVRVRS